MTVDPAATTAMVRLAGAVAPDEVDLAPAMLAAWAAGGRQRRQLFQETVGGDVAAFGPADVVAVVPAIIAGLATAATVVLPFLDRASATANASLTATNVALTLRDRREKERQRAKKQAAGAAEDAAEDGGAVAEPMLAVLDALEASLARHRIGPERRRQIGRDVLAALLAEPAEARALLKTLASSG